MGFKSKYLGMASVYGIRAGRQLIIVWVVVVVVVVNVVVANIESLVFLPGLASGMSAKITVSERQMCSCRGEGMK